MTLSCAVFETPIGACGIAWTDAGLAGVNLPAADASRTVVALARRFPGAEAASPPPVAARTIARIVAHLGGARVDYDDIPLDESRAGRFEMRVYAQARAIPFGRTLTYGAIAEALGDAGLARAVGQALGRNPWPIIIPCHRVTAADGRAGGFSAPGGAVTKLRLLEIEGAIAPDALPLFAPRP